MALWFTWEPAATKLVTYTGTFNAGKPTNSLETQSIKVLYKNNVFKSWWVNCVKIKESYLLFYKSGRGRKGAVRPSQKEWGGGGLRPPRFRRLCVIIMDWELRSQSSESEPAKMRALVEIKQKFKNSAQLLQVFINACDLTLIFPFCGLGAK